MGLIKNIYKTNNNLGNEQLDKPHFDSCLATSMVNGQTNAELTITLRILFHAVTWEDDDVYGTPSSMKIKDVGGAEFKIVEWPSSNVFDEFCRSAVWQANHYWNGYAGNGKLWLKTPDYVHGLDWPLGAAKTTHRANIWCRFRCERTKDASKAHIKVRVVRLPDKSSGPLGFRSHMTLWDHVDTLSASFSSAGSKSMFYTVVHEVGHCIGQRHIGEVHQLPACITGGSGNACYGEGSTFASNVMGLGSKIELDNAVTWQRRVVRHFPDSPSLPQDWKPSNSKVAPRLLSSFAPHSHDPGMSPDAW